MKNALNINKTVANQYLNPIIRFWAKPLMILSILLTAMFILAACGGGSGGGAVATTSDPCRGNPFGDTCNSDAHAAARKALVITCLANDKANDTECENARDAEPCIENPDLAECATPGTRFATYIADTTIVAIRNTRATYCATNSDTANTNICTGVCATDPFANDLCDDVTTIAGTRTTYCTTTNIFDVECAAIAGTTDIITGTNAARNAACLVDGTDAHASCESRANVREACNTNPFTQTTGSAPKDLCTGSTADTDGTTYESARAACAVPATSFADNCDSQDAIGDVKKARDDACAADGTGADDSCADRDNIKMACTATDPFANDGCLTAAMSVITPAERSAFCENTGVNDGPTNPFIVGCPASPALETAKDTACLAYGTTADDVCKDRTNVVEACLITDPFLHEGCSTATHVMTEQLREKYCTIGTSIFDAECDGDTYGATTALRANIVDTCMTYATSDVCTNTYVNGGSTGPTVAVCNATPFADGCATHPAFNGGRMSVCTTDATSFTAGCNDIDYVGTDAARIKFAATCAINDQITGCDARIDGSADTGPTIAQCNMTPFADGCVASPVFEAGRMSVCTTDATSFHASCSEATYTGTDDARTSFAEDCADGIVTTGCDTAYLNGVDGLTVATCNANPFDTANDCATNSAFDAERTARNTLCAADASTAFDTRCEIAEFGDDNEVNRNAYCRNTALPAEGVASANCGDARFTAICGDTTQVETNNPFAPLCGTTNTAERAAFCLLGSMQTDNPNCSEDVMAQCNRNPFGTTLGKGGTINCTADYAGQRKILADACRPATVDTTLAVFANDGATCTDAINNCNANPFGNGCDADAFADARTSYCTDPATTWQGACDAMADESTQNAVTVARSGICAANGAIMTGTIGDDVAAGESLFHADCLALTGVTDLVTINAARTDYCANDDNPWQGNCDTVAELNNDNAVITARNNVCLNNGAIPSNGANSEVILAGDSLFNALCGNVATIAAVREAECETDSFAWHTGCESFVTADDAEVIAARTDICFQNKELVRGGGTVIAAGYSFFDTLCDGQVENSVMIADARETHCEMDENAWHSGCQTFVTSGDVEVQDARTRICFENKALVVGTSDADVRHNVDADKSLFGILCGSRTLTKDSITRTTLDVQKEWCTEAGDNDANIFDPQCVPGTHGDVDAARLAACAQDTAHESVGTNNCAGARANAICGDDDNPGSNPFAAICQVATQNINYFAELEDSQQDYCGLNPNNAKGVCDDTVANVCAPGGTALATNEIFADICARATYNDAKVTYCSDVAGLGDTDCDKTIAGAGGTIKETLCDGDVVTDNPHATVCGTDATAVTRQEAFCGLDHSAAGDPTGCAGTRMVACADTDGNNPFNEDLCYEPGNTFDAQRKLRADACRGDSPTRTGDECSAEVNACNPAPFGEYNGEACSAVIYADARTAFCTEDDSDNLFDTNCAELTGTEEKIAGTLAARLKACSTLAVTDLPLNAPANACRTAALSGAICGTDAAVGSNPFAAICTDADQHDNSATHQAAVDFYCAFVPTDELRNELTNPLCEDITSADWVAGNASANSGAGLNTNPTTGNEFLVIEGNTISTTGVNAADDGADVRPEVTTLNFTQIEYAGQSLVEDTLVATDGLAFFTGFHGTDTAASAYAGIFETTDLGGPITESGAPFAAVWYGALALSGVAEARELSLSVLFSDVAGGSISGFVTDINSTDKDFLIDGTFNAAGVITGDVHYAEFTNNEQLSITTDNGDLSGIIGVDGAIAVFYNNTGDLYTGGFVASPIGGVCAANVFDVNCPVNENTTARMEFCLNATANSGTNPFNGMCDNATYPGVDALKLAYCIAPATTWNDLCDVEATYPGAEAARNRACTTYGTTPGGDLDCATRGVVTGLCDTNPYTQTSNPSDAPNVYICTTAYDAARAACEATDNVSSFDMKCDTQDAIGDVKTARDGYCSNVAGLSDANCASIRGSADRTQLICTDDIASATKPFATLCGLNTAAQLVVCKGPTANLPAGDRCATNELSGAICGTSDTTSGTNPFADVCKSSTQNVNFANLDKAKEISCGTARRASGDNFAACGLIQDELCNTGEKSLSISQGAGGFICSADNGPNVVRVRNSYCEDPATTYTTGCTNAVGADGTNVETTRKTLAAACVPGASKNVNAGSRSPDCDKPVNGVSGTSVADCSGNPYLDVCQQGNLGTEFATVLSTRRGICGITGTVGSDPFDTLCNVIASTNNAGKVDYCDESTNTWQDRCTAGGTLTDTDGAIQTARATACIANGTITTSNPGDTVATITMPLFNGVCTGLMVRNGSTVQASRSNACGGLITDLRGDGGTPALCNTYGLSDTICGTGSGGSSVAGSNPFAQLCSEADGPDSGFDVAVAQKAFANSCAENNPPEGCSKTISGVSSETTIAACVANPYITLHGCAGEAFADVRSVRHAICGSAPSGAVGTNPFDSKCDGNQDKITDQGTYCTTGNKDVFNSNCQENTHGEVAKARATACRLGPDFTGLSPIPLGQRCGDEETNNGNLVYTYCQANAASDKDNCPKTFAALADGECIANPWGTGGGSACDPTTYYSNRLGYCAPGADLPTGAPSNACTELAKRTCRDGGEGATTPNPFHETCYVGTTYNNERSTACRDNTQGTGECDTPAISNAVCLPSGQYANPFATFCNTGIDHRTVKTDIIVVRQNFCGATRTRDSSQKEMDCDILQNGLCTGATLVSNVGQGAANFICLTDDEPAVVTARGTFCADPNTTYTSGCTNAHSNTTDAVLNARKQLAQDCVVGGNKGAAHADCIKPVNGSSGTTVAGCSADPHQADCTSGAVGLAFADVLTTRDNLCITSRPSSDPFNTLCAPFPTRNAQLIDYCDETNTAWEDRCGTGITSRGAIDIVRARACIANTTINTGTVGAPVPVAQPLFTSRCNGLVVAGTSDTVLKTRRALALSCRTGSNAGCDQRADGASGKTVAECTRNPYDTTGTVSCFTNDAFDAERTDRLTRCVDEATTFDALCNFVDATTNVPTIFTEKNGIRHDIRLARGTVCVGMAPSSSRNTMCGIETGGNKLYLKEYCDDDLGLVNQRDCPVRYAAWHPDTPASVTVTGFNATPDTIRSTNKNSPLNSDGTGLLKRLNTGTAHSTNDDATNFILDDVANPNVLDLGSDAGAAVSASTGHLTLNNIDVAHNNAASGFAFTQEDTASKLYVGLLSGTNLGAPQPNRADTDITWGGLIRAVINTTGSTYATGAEFSFTLNINFDLNTLTTSGVQVPNLLGLNINGNFTDNGVIYGTVDIAGSNTGTLTGLIGAKGAVGIFKSDDNASTNRYVGGFVAAPVPPTVVFADWTASFASGGFIANDSREHGDLFPTGDAVTTIDDGRTRFLQWTATPDFALDGVNKLTIGGDNTGTLLLNNETNNGIGFVYDTTITPAASRGFAGLLSATNVGLPLDTIATATWNGTIAGVANGKAFNDTSFALIVDYTKTSASNAGTVTSNVRAFGVTDGSTMVSFGFNGTFNDAGVMIGAVEHVFNTASSSTDRAGVFNGLIGQNGAVGVFKSNDSANFSPYVGGFVVKPGSTAPPVEEEVDCTDALGATLFDESCTDNDDEQTRACINGTDAATANFDANCVDNERVTNLVCAPSGLRANPFNAALCTDLNTGNTLAVKKSLSLISAPILLQQI